ncbi:porin family protein [Mesorhizobium sp. PAMC28654]|uniref:outer membrane protein n=1 Tax=Mesorhizobium sp. PAMC28654 TaxID=2880934 RepID=UPI001D0B43C0|nr:outer membrane protein [Mesorhizobium sp. PAMC28654]UDL87333.1 porin family protein [Mesorhizobium sp. PAMC28654]
MLNRLLLASTFLVTLVGGAAAADIMNIASQPAGFVWTGGYVGLNAGYGWGRVDNIVHSPIDGPIGNLPTLEPKGFLGGIQAGYNYQMNNVVIGVEGDITFGKLNDSAYRDPIPQTNYFETEYRSLATLRGRLGFAVDRLLVYGTAGLAVADIKDRYGFQDDPGFDYTRSGWKAGWTIGVGGEYAVTNQWTIKAEYLHADFGSRDLNVGDAWGDIGSPDSTQTSDHTLNVVRVGLNYKF